MLRFCTVPKVSFMQRFHCSLSVHMIVFNILYCSHFLCISHCRAMYWSGPCACTVGDEEEVSVPRTACTLTDEEMAYLKQTIDPMDSCNDGGIGLYTAARCIVHAFCT